MVHTSVQLRYCIGIKIFSDMYKGPCWVGTLACRARGVRLLDGFNWGIILVFMDPLLCFVVSNLKGNSHKVVTSNLLKYIHCKCTAYNVSVVHK